MFRLLTLLVCFWGRKSVAEWTTKGHQIFYETDVYSIKGFNWFGAETECGIPHGLWVHSMDYFLDLMRSYQFNSIRIPFSFENVQKMEEPIKMDCISAIPELYGKTFQEGLHVLFQAAQKRGMTVLLDFHTIGGVITEFPTTDTVTKDQYFQTWERMLLEYGEYPNLIGIDIKNEPHGNIRWSMWGPFVQEIMLHIYTHVPQFKGLFFVEGVQDPLDHSVWGGSFSKVDNHLGSTPDPQIVFSPHVYGVSVRGDDALYDEDSRWDLWFASLYSRFSNPICIGEIGGWFEGDDRNWHYKVLDFLQRSSLHNFFYWCLNPNSIDTGGLLEMDWTTVNQEKIDFCNQLQPGASFPTFRS